MEWDEEAFALLDDLDAAGREREARAVAEMIRGVREGKRWDVEGVEAIMPQLIQDAPELADRVDRVFMSAPRSFAGVNVSRVESGARGATQGASFGFSDEIIGGARGVADVTGLGWLGDQITGAGVRLIGGEDASREFARNTRENRDLRRDRQRQMGGGLGAAIEDRVGMERRLNEVARAENPVSFGALEFVGGGVTGGVGLARSGGKMAARELLEEGATEGAKKQARRQAAIRSGQVGAVQGAAAGVGYSDTDDPFEIAMNTAFGGTLGGTVGRAAPAVFGGIARGAAGVRDAAGRLVSPKARAANKVKAALDSDDMTLPQAQQMIDEGRARGADVGLADVSETARRELGSAMQTPGSATKATADRLTDRNRGQRERLVERLEETIGGGQVLDTFEDAVEAAKQSARPLYEKAYAEPFDLTETISRIMTSTMGKKAAGRVEELMDAGRAVGDLSPQDSYMNPVAYTHYMVRALRDVGSEQGLGKESQRLARRMATQLSDELKKQNKFFRDAQKLYADEFKNDEAIEFGKKVWSMRSFDVEKQWSKMSASERDNARIAFIREAIEKLGNKRDNTNQALDFDKDTLRKKIRLMFDGKADFDEFMKAVGDEEAMSRTFARAMQGSNTAENIQRNLVTRSDFVTGLSGGFIGANVAGIPGAIAGMGGTIAARHIDDRLRHKANEHLTRYLLDENPTALLENLLPNRRVVSPTGQALTQASIGATAGARDRALPPPR